MFTAHPVILLKNRKFVLDLPNLTFATAIALWSAWFCWDAWRAGSEIENLILIVPLALAAIILYFFVAAGCITAVDKAAAPRHPLTLAVGLKIAGTMALLAAFVVTGPLIGFDVAALVYMLAMMLLLGERRIVLLVLVPVIFCAVVIYCFNNLLATPLPLLFFHGDV